MSDLVNSPNHYTIGGIEAIDVIRAKLTPEEYVGYCKGSILHYLMRSNWKGEHDQDCRKAEWYAKELARAVHERARLAATPEQVAAKIPPICDDDELGDTSCI